MRREVHRAAVPPARRSAGHSGAGDVRRAGTRGRHGGVRRRRPRWPARWAAARAASAPGPRTAGTGSSRGARAQARKCSGSAWNWWGPGLSGARSAHEGGASRAMASMMRDPEGRAADGLAASRAPLGVVLLEHGGDADAHDLAAAEPGRCHDRIVAGSAGAGWHSSRCARSCPRATWVRSASSQVERTDDRHGPGSRPRTPGPAPGSGRQVVAPSAMLGRLGRPPDDQPVGHDVERQRLAAREALQARRGGRRPAAARWRAVPMAPESNASRVVETSRDVGVAAFVRRGVGGLRGDHAGTRRRGSASGPGCGSPAPGPGHPSRPGAPTTRRSASSPARCPAPAAADAPPAARGRGRQVEVAPLVADGGDDARLPDALGR